MSKRPPPRPPLSRRLRTALGGWLTPVLVAVVLAASQAVLGGSCFGSDCQEGGALAALLIVLSVAALLIWCASWLVRGLTALWRRR
jgi:hypothetical protein